MQKKCTWARPAFRMFGYFTVIVLIVSAMPAQAQVDPMVRNQLQLGYDQDLEGDGPQALYTYYYLNLPQFLRTNVTMRMAFAAVYMDSEIGIQDVLTPNTDIGFRILGGGMAHNYYEVREGDYIRSQSFNGHGGGSAFSIYHRVNPEQRVPLHLVARAGFQYVAFTESCNTDSEFELPDNGVAYYTRAGFRLGGKEPRLYPDLAMEFSMWFQREWRMEDSEYGFENDRAVSPAVNLYWFHASLNYAWTNSGNRMSVAFTGGGSEDADRFSAWRLGGVLPLADEFPLIIPGYYFEEISAERFVHLYASYSVPLDRQDRWGLRFEGAAARVDYLDGFEQEDDWHKGAGAALIYTSPNKVLKVALRYGYGFDAIRDDDEGAHSVGVLLQYDFDALMRSKWSKQQ